MKRTLRHDQAGLVAILVTMIMMIVISLIVIGFSQVTRRNAREALDSQLGTQAYYAAETGVNDATGYIQANLSGITPITDCKGNSQLTVPRALKPDNSVAYTCVMINPTPSSLVVQNLTPSSTTVWDVKNATGANFGSLTFNWKPSKGASGGCAATGSVLKTYPIAGSWNCDHALVRVDVVPANTALNPTTLANNTETLFLQPTASSPTNVTVAGFGIQRKAYQGSCVPAANGDCSVKVTLGAAAQQNEYYVRITTLYEDTSLLTLTGTSSGGGTASFANGQVVIDSTGRAQDQVKRIQVRVPITTQSGLLPIFGLQSTETICKDLAVSSTVYNNGCTGTWPPGLLAAAGCTQAHDIVLVLDASSSMLINWQTKTRIAELKQVAAATLPNVDLGSGPYQTRVGVISFNDNATVVSGFSSDITTLSNKISGVTTGYSTDYLAALNAASNMLDGGRASARKVLVFISDGVPDVAGNTSTTINTATDAMKNNGIAIYTIGITLDTNAAAQALLKSMASGTGGSSQYYSASQESDLQTYFDAIAYREHC